MRNLALFCYGHRRLVLIGWVVFLLALFALSTGLGSKFRTEFELPASESARALDLLEERGVPERGGFTGQIVFRADQGVNDPAVRRTMEDFFARVAAAVDGEQINSPYDPANSHQISADGKTGYAEINLSHRDQSQFLDDGKHIKALVKTVNQPGLQIELGGDIFVEEASFSSELVGIVAAIIILLIAFGSLLAVGLPIMTALFGIGCGAAAIGLVTHVMTMPDFTTQIAAMIAIGVGIDYALIVVTRYREAIHSGMNPKDSVSLALDTSGRAVLFAGLTVIISLFGMFMMNMDFVRAVAIGSILAVLMTMLASLTLLPALLGFVGNNIDKFAIPHLRHTQGGGREKTFWYRWSRLIQAHPWPALILSAGLLITLALPVFALRLGIGDAGNRPSTDTTRRAYDMLSEAFGPGFNQPFLIVVDTPGGSADLQKVQTIASAIQQTPGVGSTTAPQMLPDAHLALINAFASSSPQDKETTDLVHRLRKETLPPVEASTGLQVYTSGGPAIIVDFSDYIASRLPLFIGAVLLLSFLLLMTVFHSVVVPLKAVIMNMLSIGASFGAMVAVFQWGFMDGVFGLGKEGPIDAWIPMMLFAILFGLSMDYEVFLLTRVREEYDRTGDNRQAVADGLAATGRVISAAAAIMVCVFGAFILGAGRDIKLVGFGLAFAVLIDATVVRLVLVPAAMELMGNANWWAPSWLVRVLPTIRIDTEQPLESERPVR